jgi:hypothetical protein
MLSTRIWFPRLAILIVTLVFTAMYILQPGGVRPLESFSDLACLLAAALAAALAFAARARFDRGSLQRRAWLLLGVGLAMWAAAELLWMYLEVGVGDDVPYPSPADFIWAVGYIPLIIGLFIGYRALGVRLPARHRLVVALAYAVLLAALAYGLLDPMFLGHAPASPAEAFFGSVYLVGDLTLAFIATLSLVVVWDGLIGRPWLAITIGMLLFALSDSGFSYADWAGIYAVGANWESAVIDVMYLAAYLLLALGAYRQATLRLDDVHPRRIAV